MIARYDSDCDRCGELIEGGQDEVFSGGEGCWICYDCHQEDTEEQP